MTPCLTCSQDNSVLQLEDGYPAALRGMDDANEHHFIGGNIALPHHPLEGLDRNALAILKLMAGLG